MTSGPIGRHIVRMAAPMAAGLILSTMYVLVDLFFVAKLGDAAIAGVGSAGNIQFLVMAVTQVFSVGTMVLVSHATGRQDRAEADGVFHEALVLSLWATLAMVVLGLPAAGWYVRTVAADPATIAAGTAYLRAYLPGLALQFPMAVMGAALRGVGLAGPGMAVQLVTVLLNLVLAPVLIAGIGTGHPLGVTGAGLASSIAIVAGVIYLVVFLGRGTTIVRFDRAHWGLTSATARRVLAVGLPAGGEFAMMFILTATMYWIIRDFGAAAQAGYGIGSRVMQALILPSMALAFAIGPVAGQNVGAGLADRVRQTFRTGTMMSVVMMLGLTVLAQLEGDTLVRLFTREAAVIAVGTGFLHVISLNFVASGLIFTCSGMFQALGNTMPSLISGATRLALFVLPALWLSRQPGFTLRQAWFLSVGTTTAQALFSLWLVRHELRTRLPLLVPRGATASVAPDAPGA